MLIVDQLRKSDRHLQVIAVAVLVGIGVLFGRLWQLQVVSAKHYQDRAEEQTMRLVRVPAVRGKILDRNRLPLADNRPNFSVNVYLEEFSKRFRQEYRIAEKKALDQIKAQDPTRTRLTSQESSDLQWQVRYDVVRAVEREILQVVGGESKFNEAKFQRHWGEQRALPFPVIENLEPKQVARFLEQIPPDSAVQLEAQAFRTYPFGETAAHVLGHLKRRDTPSNDDEEFSFNYRLMDFGGDMGIEGEYDDVLRGKPGVKALVLNSLLYRQSEQMMVPPIPGSNVVLTLDIAIQQTAEKALRRIGDHVRGAAVVMDVRTGDILALASAPTFDPNLFVPGISTEDWSRVSDTNSRPLFNRAASATYPPGSTFKIVSGLAALDAGVVNPNEIYVSKGYFKREGGRPIQDTAGPGNFDFSRAFYLSSNPYFIEYGSKAGSEVLIDWGRRFGLGERTGIVGLNESKASLPKPEDLKKRNWYQADTDLICIGQGQITVTPLQMAVLTAAVANGGTVLQPRLISQIEPVESDGEVAATVHFPVRQVRSQVIIDPHHLEVLRHAMLLDVEHPEGTGRSAALPGLRICGKTGTAQTRSGSFDDKVTWFVSYAPYESPRYAVVVVVEDGGGGGKTCAPMARDIYQTIQWREQGKPLFKPRTMVSNN